MSIVGWADDNTVVGKVISVVPPDMNFRFDLPLSVVPHNVVALIIDWQTIR
jgi:hypothetical protein